MDELHVSAANKINFALLGLATAALVIRLYVRVSILRSVGWDEGESSGGHDQITGCRLMTVIAALVLLSYLLSVALLVLVVECR